MYEWLDVTSGRKTGSADSLLQFNEVQFWEKANRMQREGK